MHGAGRRPSDTPALHYALPRRSEPPPEGAREGEEGDRRPGRHGIRISVGVPLDANIAAAAATTTASGGAGTAAEFVVDGTGDTVVAVSGECAIVTIIVAVEEEWREFTTTRHIIVNNSNNNIIFIVIIIIIKFEFCYANTRIDIGINIC